jgi:hypothetical protein
LWKAKRRRDAGEREALDREVAETLAGLIRRLGFRVKVEP